MTFLEKWMNHALYNSIALQKCLRSDITIPPEVVQLLIIVLAILGFLILLFQLNLRIVLSNSMMEFVAILLGITLNLYIALGKMAISTILILPIHEHGRSFLLLMTSLISFFIYLKFQTYRPFPCLVAVTPRYFILFVAIVNNAISLISFSACLSFEYRTATDLLELILYLVNLQKFISCRSSLEEFLVVV